VLDADGSDELTFREFRRAVRDFGFDGDPKEFFVALGTDVNGRLTIDEVAFLDAWEVDDPDVTKEEDDEDDGSKKLSAMDGKTKLLQFTTISPGPGAYDLPDILGEKGGIAKNNGIYSFRRRGKSIWDGPNPMRASTPEPGPAHYHPTEPVEPGRPSTSRETSGPSWGFSRGKRSTIVARTHANPGPGTYQMDGDTGSGRSFPSPAYSMVPRRGGNLHPLHKYNQRLFQEIQEKAKAW
jgi:hypothetical protein